MAILFCVLTHWSRVTHICVSKLTSIGSDNGLSPNRRQAIIWTKAGILLFWPLGTNFSEIFIGIHIYSFNKMPLKMSSAKCRPSSLSLNVLSKVISKINVDEVIIKLCFVIVWSIITAQAAEKVALWRTVSGDAVLDRSIEILCGKISEGPATQQVNWAPKK